MSCSPDEESQQDMFQASDEEAEEDNLEAQKWRLERHEREKFLLQQVQTFIRKIFIWNAVQSNFLT